LEKLTSELEEELAKIYVGQNVRSEGILQSEIKKERAVILLSEKLIKENHWYAFGLYVTTVEGEKYSRGILGRKMTEADLLLESRIAGIPRRIIPFLIRRYVMQGLTFPAQRPEFYEFYDSWPKKLVSDGQVWSFCGKFFDALQVMGLCVKTHNYVSTRGGELRELQYVISPEVQEFLKRKFQGVDFSPEEERNLRIFHVLVQMKNFVRGDNLEFIREKFYELLKQHTVSEDEIASVIDNMSELNIASKYRGLLSNEKPFEVYDLGRFGIYLDDKLIKPAVELLLGKRSLMESLRVTRKLPKLEQVQEKLGILSSEERADFFLVVTEFEVGLRQFVKSKLGHGWETKIENDLPEIMNNWEDKKRKDEKWGIDPEHDLLNYADLSDYIQIFRKYNRMFFSNDEERGDVESHLKDWYNFGRNPLMHARIVNEEKYHTTLSAIKFLRSWIERSGS
jgi:hypothetical protein